MTDGKAFTASKTMGGGVGYVARLNEKIVFSCADGKRPQMSK